MGIGGKWGNIGKSWIVLRESGNLLEKLGKHGIYAGYLCLPGRSIILGTA